MCCGRSLDKWLTCFPSQVTAVDLWPARLPEEPDNLSLEVYNLNDPLSGVYSPGTYDLIHSRFLAAGIKKNRWRSYVKDLSRLLQHGGWLQMVEYHFIIQSDSGLLTDSHAIQQWQAAYKWYMDLERDPRIGRRLTQHMRDAGLDRVQEQTYRLPIGSWPTGMYPACRTAACRGIFPSRYVGEISPTKTNPHSPEASRFGNEDLSRAVA
jgi:hypothetical protein